MNYIDWFFSVLTNLVHGLNPTWSWYILFTWFDITGFALLVFCKGFLHLCSRGRLLCKSLMYLSGFAIRVRSASSNQCSDVLSSCFLKVWWSVSLPKNFNIIYWWSIQPECSYLIYLLGTRLCRLFVSSCACLVSCGFQKMFPLPTRFIGMKLLRSFWCK